MRGVNYENVNTICGKIRTMERNTGRGGRWACCGVRAEILYGVVWKSLTDEAQISKDMSEVKEQVVPVLE